MKIGSHFKITLLILLLTFSAWDSPLHSQERFRKTPPYPEPLSELKLPEIQSTSLSNGLSLLVIHRDNHPVISLKVIISAGESSSPEKLPGIATLTAKMLSRGVSYLSSSAIEEKIEYIGGSFSSSTYADYSVFAFTFLDEYLDEALELLSRMFLQPTFIKREIDNVKREMYYEMVKQSADPEILAKRQLLRLLFRNHNYEKITYSEDVIKNLNQMELVSFFKKFYRPNNAHFVLTGNLNLRTASRKISQYFRSWRKKDLKRSFSPPPEPYKKEKICFVNLPKAKDVTIYLGNIILHETNRYLFPLMVMNQVLGGTPNSRLFMNLRESKGYAYHAFSEVELFNTCSIFFIKARVRPEFTLSVIKEALREIEKIAHEKIPSFEIEQAKSYLVGNFPLQIETFDNLASKVSEIKAFNLGEEYWHKYYENIMLINSEKVFEITNKYFLPTPVVVIVGDKNLFMDHITDHINEIKEVEIYDTKGIYQFSIKKGDGE